jgi:DNA-binding transcriptional ArsR family regulator
MSAMNTSRKLPVAPGPSQKAFDALGDATRRSIFERLQHGPLAVVQIAEGLPVSRPAVSQHLKVLREAKLISINSRGTRNIYQVEKEGIIAMRNYLDRFWNEALENFKRLAEQAEKKRTADGKRKKPN